VQDWRNPGNNSSEGKNASGLRRPSTHKAFHHQEEHRQNLTEYG